MTPFFHLLSSVGFWPFLHCSRAMSHSGSPSLITMVGSSHRFHSVPIHSDLNHSGLDGAFWRRVILLVDISSLLLCKDRNSNHHLAPFQERMFSFSCSSTRFTGRQDNNLLVDSCFEMGHLDHQIHGLSPVFSC